MCLLSSSSPLSPNHTLPSSLTFFLPRKLSCHPHLLHRSFSYIFHHAFFRNTGLYIYHPGFFLVFIYLKDFFKNKFIYLFYLFYFWLCWVFVAVLWLSLVAESRGCSLLRCAGFSLRWLLSLWSTGCRCSGFSSCGTQTQELWLMGFRVQA